MNGAADESWIHEQMQLPSSELGTSAWYTDPTSSASSPTASGLATNGYDPHAAVHSSYVVDNAYQQSQSSYMPQYHQPAPVTRHTIPSHNHQPERPPMTQHTSYESHPENPIPNVTVHNSTNYTTPTSTIDPATYYAGYTAPSFPYTATYSSTPSTEESHNPYTPQTSYSYGALNGTPVPAISAPPPAAEPPQQITIDPALVSISPLAKQYAAPPPTTTQTTYRTISPSSLHPNIPAPTDPSSFYGQPPRPHSQSQSATPAVAPKPAKALTPPSSAPPSMSSSSRPTTMSLLRKAQPTALKELLSPESLERSPIAAANSLIKALAQMGFSETSPSLRKDILNAMRDNAGKDFYEAWAKNPDGMEMFRVWLKSASTKKDANGRKEVEETLMPLLNVIDRLPLGFEELRTSRIGKFIKNIVADPPSKAAKDLASILTQKWTNLIAQQQKKALAEDESKAGSPLSPADAANKKRKAVEAPTVKTPPMKKPTPQTTSAATTTTTLVKKEPGVKTEPGVSTTTTTKAAKTDNSFFSAPKKKPLPTFKKVPKKEEGTTSPGVAQPSNVDPFQEALKALTAKGTPAVKMDPTQPASGASGSGSTSGTGAEKIDSPMSVDTPPTTLNMNNVAGSMQSLFGKRKKSVTFPTDDKLESIRWITRAEYGDDASEPMHSLNGVKALDRDEGRALHGHLFQEAIDWYEPTLIEILQNDLEERGIDSVEKKIQEEREKNALVASYMSDSLIPDSANELHPGIGTSDPDAPAPVAMLPGPEISEIIAGLNTTTPTSLGDLLAQITPSSANAGAPVWGQPAQSQAQPFGSAAGAQAFMQQLGTNGIDFSQVLSGMTPEMLQALQQQLAQATGAGIGGSTPVPGPGVVPNGYGQGPGDQNGFGALGSFGNDGQFQWGTDGRESARNGWGSEGDDGWGGDSGGGSSSSSSGYRGRSRGRGRGRGRGGGPKGDRPRPLCNFFAKGYCRFGEACDFWHDPSLAHNQRKP
ncbi:uncharacterized protein EI90DRAFT_3049046 [Cantharellus anzutake]|uniref:uncharacterized protein n=1 Tax=Cantharellus anzutake TaxID=1750568 RepID=UPI001904EE93|nr:uncharacterized protein EI90DRAFT_3049046 [Cantharellus anzutake]KAF8334960.1 hypothetical protein EI90DRAFT_3049046 [Cantharellus anzutake]